nr:hypothetical protein [Candidatus Sigynarchaeota archaeon]
MAKKAKDSQGSEGKESGLAKFGGKFKEKFFVTFNYVAENLFNVNVALKKLIKQNQDWINANQRLGKEAKEAIDSLKEYAELETPGIKDAFTTMSEAMASVEKNRGEFLGRLQEQFISPLSALDEGWKKLQKEIDEDKAAEKAVQKTESDLEKLKAKPAEKLKPGDVEGAEAKLKAAKEKAVKEHDDVVRETAAYTALKVKTLKDSLERLAMLQTEFYEISLDIISGVNDKIKAINIDAETEASTGGN